MATKLKIAPKSKEKPEADKAAEKAAKEAMISAEVENVVPSIKEFLIADNKAKGKFFALIEQVRAWVKENSASKAEVQTMLRIAFAQAGEYDAKELTGSDGLLLHPYDTQQINTLVNTCVPKKAEFAKALDKAIADKKSGKKTYSNAAIKHTAATGEPPTEKKAGRKPNGATSGNGNKPAKAKGYDTLDDYKTELAGLLQKCEKAEFDDEEVEDATVDQMEEWKSRPKDETEESEETEAEESDEEDEEDEEETPKRKVRK